MTYFVCDTNVWYGIARGDLDPSSLKRGGNVLAASMINFIELLSGMNTATFDLRHKVVQTVVKWADDYLPDNESHLAAVWSHPKGRTTTDWRNAFQLAARARRLRDYWAGYVDRGVKCKPFGMVTLTAARPRRYQEFVHEVEAACETVQPGFMAARAAGKVKLIKKDQRRVLEELLYSPTSLDRLASVTRARVEDWVSAPFEPSLAETSLARSRLDSYVKAYAAYVVYAASTGPPDQNDLGDIEFFLYIQDGRVFLTNEDRWHRVAEMAGISGLVVRPALAVPRPARVDTVAPVVVAPDGDSRRRD